MNLSGCYTPKIKGNGVSSPPTQQKFRLRRARNKRFYKVVALRAGQTPTPHGRTCGTPPTRRGRPNGCAESVRAGQSMGVGIGTRLTALSCAILHRIGQAKQAGRMG